MHSNVLLVLFFICFLVECLTLCNFRAHLFLRKFIINVNPIPLIRPLYRLKAYPYEYQQKGPRSSQMLFTILNINLFVHSWIILSRFLMNWSYSKMIF